MYKTDGNKTELIRLLYFKKERSSKNIIFIILINNNF